MRCKKAGHELRQDASGLWWHVDETLSCPSIPDCPHTNVEEYGRGDASCQSGTRMHEDCIDCSAHLRSYPLPVLLS